ncbi:hypothetical protein FQN60_001083 [Etheostoma spectabile]|uniref:Uncharacterized protein n=1 Tax=Etheostoma spectabile TaxID=54343 RepID=A0A5J5CA74_9PERO|nr:hypothetical protein FQN60_001083 [Etheostoma spectabile]
MLEKTGPASTSPRSASSSSRVRPSPPTISTASLRLCEYSTCSTFKVGRHRMHSKQKSPIPARSSAHVSSPG